MMGKNMFPAKLLPIVVVTLWLSVPNFHSKAAYGDASGDPKCDPPCQQFPPPTSGDPSYGAPAAPPPPSGYSIYGTPPPPPHEKGQSSKCPPAAGVQCCTPPAAPYSTYGPPYSTYGPPSPNLYAPPNPYTYVPYGKGQGSMLLPFLVVQLLTLFSSFLLF